MPTDGQGGTQMEEGPCRVHKLVADVCLIQDRRVLFVRYKNTAAYDGEQGWFLPDDFLRHSEHPEDAAKRILQSQAGVSSPSLHLGHIESFEGHGYWHLIFHCLASATTSRLTPGENVAQSEWFPLDQLPPAEKVAHGGWGLETLQKLLENGG